METILIITILIFALIPELFTIISVGISKIIDKISGDEEKKD